MIWSGHKTCYSEQQAKGYSPFSYVRASRGSPTFTGALSMLRHGLLEFLSIVYNSFQRYTFIVFISCDVNRRIMLQENRCKRVYIIPYGWFLFTLQIMKNKYVQFFCSLNAISFYLIFLRDGQYHSTRLLVTWNSVFLTRETMTLQKQTRNMSRDSAERCLEIINRNHLKSYWISPQLGLQNSCLSSGKHPFDYLLYHFQVTIALLAFSTWGLIFW